MVRGAHDAALFLLLRTYRRVRSSYCTYILSYGWVTFCGKPPCGTRSRSPPFLRGAAHLVVEGRDEPQLHLEVGASLLSGNELQQVLVLHAGRAEDFPLTLPRLLVLRQGRSQTSLQPHPEQNHPPHPIPTSADTGGSRRPRLSRPWSTGQR